MSILFKELEIYPEILRAVEDMGFVEASPIQEQSIPLLMDGTDFIGQAQTGTGKTAAFGIPLLQKIGTGLRQTQAIILCPTRELAMQVSGELHNLSKYMHGVRIVPIYGGQDIGKQIRSLKGGVHIIVGTPGRVMDHLRRKTIKCDYVQTVILDEADEMLNMGFREDIETVLQYIPNEHQTVLFSATMPKEILEIAKQYQHDAKTVKITKKELTVENIEQYYFNIHKKDKKDVLMRLLDVYDPKISLVFCNTKSMTDELTKDLVDNGFSAESLHGDMKQQERDRVMKNFRGGRTAILVATDVAARGIDVDDVEVVFNYDLPQDDEYYVHRIGRTGRAGKTGKAFSLIKTKDMRKLKDIQYYCKCKIKELPVPGKGDVEEAKCDKVMENLMEILRDKDLTRMKKIIANRTDGTKYDELDIAAALLFDALGKNTKKPEIKGDLDLSFTGAKDEGMARFFINVGKRDHVRPGDIVGAIAGECKIPGSCIGAIDMYDSYSFVEVPLEYGYTVLESMKNVKIKGRQINIEPANMN